MFQRFRCHVEKSGLSLSDVVADVVRVAGEYRKLETADCVPDLRPFLHRWQVVEAGVATPVLLWLFSAGRDVLDPTARIRCCAALESFLVRRMVCRLTTGLQPTLH